jgi:sugar/nucleoside kinase (ribokinase family)
MSSLLPPEAGIVAQVIGAAYLDEVVDVEGALCPDGRTRIDYSRTEACREPLPEPGVAYLIESPGGDSIRIADPAAQSGTRIVLAEDRILDTAGKAAPLRSEVALRGRRVLLGGMGAGYALALGGRLVLPLGEAGPEGQEVRRLLGAHGIAFRAVPVAGQSTDTTVLIWSSAGDKLPIGRRTASRAVSAQALLEQGGPADLTVVTSLPNATVAQVVRELRGWVMFTPSLRNVREGGLDEIAEHVDAIAMNRIEWRRAEAQMGERCPLVTVTRGADGAAVRFRDESGALRWTEVPAAPVPALADANRAGEAFASGFLAALVERQWPEAVQTGRYSPEAVREAAWQGSLAAALELGIRELAFPSRDDVAAYRHRIPPPWERSE